MFFAFRRVLFSSYVGSFFASFLVSIFGRFLVRFWGHFGSILGPFWRPKSVIFGIDFSSRAIFLMSKRVHDVGGVWMVCGCHFWTVLGSVLGGQERPKSAQERPKSSQERPKSAQERPKSAQKRPKSGQERPKSGQERPKSSQERPKSGQKRPMSDKKYMFVLLFNILKAFSKRICFEKMKRTIHTRMF